MKNTNIQTVKLNLSKAPTKRLKRTGKKKSQCGKWQKRAGL